MNVCKNCGYNVQNKFCGQCGEKVYTESDRSFSHLFHEAFHFLTHFEGKFFTTLKTMVRHPGKLSEDFCNGVRKKYFKPLSLYLLLIILYLLFPFFEGLNQQLRYYYNNPLYGKHAAAVAETIKTKKNISEEELSAQFARKSEKTSKFLLFILIPCFAAVTYLFAFKKRKFYFDHFIFATEALSFFVFFGFLIVPLIVWLFLKLDVQLFFDQEILATVMFTGAGIYTGFAATRFFKIKRFVSLPFSVLLMFALFGIIEMIYKFFLFTIVTLLV